MFVFEWLFGWFKTPEVVFHTLTRPKYKFHDCTTRNRFSDESERLRFADTSSRARYADHV